MQSDEELTWEIRNVCNLLWRSTVSHSTRSKEWNEKIEDIIIYIHERLDALWLERLENEPMWLERLENEPMWLERLENEPMWLDCSREDIEKARSQADSKFANNEVGDEVCELASRNILCLNKFFEWLGEQALTVDVCIREDLQMWKSLINGGAIQLGEIKLILIPSKMNDCEDIRVHKNWLYHPEFAGDYYLAIKVNVEENECFVAGCAYTSHQYLRMNGIYNSIDSTYSLKEDEYNENFDLILWDEQLVSKEPFKPLGALVSNDEGINQLSHRGRGFPAVRSWRERLEDVFDGTWQTVSEIIDRIGTPEPSFVFAGGGGDQRFRDSENLADNTITALISLLSTSRDKLRRLRAIELLGRNAHGNQEAIACLVNLLNTSTDKDLRREAAVSLGEIDLGNAQAGIRRVKMIDLGMPQHQVALVLTFTPGSEQNKMQIYLLANSVDSEFLPSNLEMSVLDEEGETFNEITPKTDDYAMQLDLAGEEGDRFTVRLALGHDSFTEEFVL